MRDVVAMEPATKEGKLARDRVIESLEILIPFLETEIDTYHLVLVNELRNAGGELPKHELFRRASTAGVRAGLGGKLTRLYSAVIIVGQNGKIILTELGEKSHPLLLSFYELWHIKPNKGVNSGSIKRRSFVAPLYRAGYAWRSASEKR